MRKRVAENAITLLSKTDANFFPLVPQSKIAYLGIGISAPNAMANMMRSVYNADLHFIDLAGNGSQLEALKKKLLAQYQYLVIGVHNISRTPANNFGISKEVVSFIREVEQQKSSFIFLFGNAYAAKNWCDAKNLAVAYENDSIVHGTAIEMLQGKIPFRGTTPVTICEKYPFGFGIKNADELESRKKKVLHKLIP